MNRLLLALAFLFSFNVQAALAQCTCLPGEEGWKTSWLPGDGGLQATEVRQFASFNGSIYAAVGGWMDQTAPRGSAQILRLDSPDGKWVQEVKLAGDATTTGGLATLRFGQSMNGSPVDTTVLVAATWSGANAYTRNELDKKWYKQDFGTGQNRAFGIHADVPANNTFSFVGGKPGIFRGQLANSVKAGMNPITWNTKIELNTVSMNLPLCSGGGRVTGFAEARGKLFASACWRVFVRTDGAIGKCSGPSQVEVKGTCEARWKRFWDDPLAGQGESGLRGLTTITYQSKQFLLIGSEVANAHITRLDPDSAESVVEFNVDKYLDNLWGVNSGYKIIPYNAPAPLWYGPDGTGRRILGFESWLPGAPKPDLSRKLVNLKNDGTGQQMLGEGMFFIRTNGIYTLQHIPAITPQPMTSIRDCIASPFKNECNDKGQDCVLYCGGFDANKSTTQTPCLAGPCKVPPLKATPTHATGFIVKGRISLSTPSEAQTLEQSVDVPDRSEDEDKADDRDVVPSTEPNP